MTLRIYGASDDLIEVEGDLSEEFNVYNDSIITVSDGTVLSASYTNEGLWRFERLSQGKADYTNLEAFDFDDDGLVHPGTEIKGYTDLVILDNAEFEWVTCGKRRRS